MWRVSAETRFCRNWSTEFPHYLSAPFGAVSGVPTAEIVTLKLSGNSCRNVASFRRTRFRRNCSIEFPHTCKLFCAVSGVPTAEIGILKFSSSYRIRCSIFAAVLLASFSCVHKMPETRCRAPRAITELSLDAHRKNTSCEDSSQAERGPPHFAEERRAVAVAMATIFCEARHGDCQAQDVLARHI
jgi:hypothetical protein